MTRVARADGAPKSSSCEPTPSIYFQHRDPSIPAAERPPESRSFLSTHADTSSTAPDLIRLRRPCSHERTRRGRPGDQRSVGAKPPGVPRERCDERAWQRDARRVDCRVLPGGADAQVGTRTPRRQRRLRQGGESRVLRRRRAAGADGRRHAPGPRQGDDCHGGYRATDLRPAAEVHAWRRRRPAGRGAHAGVGSGPRGGDVAGCRDAGQGLPRQPEELDADRVAAGVLSSADRRRAGHVAAGARAASPGHVRAAGAHG